MDPRAARKLGSEQFGGDVQAPEIRVNRDVQNLAFPIAHGARNQESGDAILRQGVIDHSHLAIESQIVLASHCDDWGAACWMAVSCGRSRSRAGRIHTRAGIRLRRTLADGRRSGASRSSLHMDAACTGDLAPAGVIWSKAWMARANSSGWSAIQTFERVFQAETRATGGLETTARSIAMLPGL